jgi:uncharacterized protein (TIGR03435 family)
MTPLAEMLAIRRPLLGRIVQDRTGLAGPYNIELEFDFNAANQPDYSGPSIFTALKGTAGRQAGGGQGAAGSDRRGRRQHAGREMT